MISRSISSLFIYLLIGLYALLSLLLVMIGVGAYQSVVRDGEHSSQLRTSLGYIAGMVRAGDEAGSVSVERIEGVSVLSLLQRFDDEVYITRIYSLPGGEDHQPGLYELFTSADEEPNLGDGQHIASVAAFDAEASDGGVELSVTTQDGEARRMFLRLRSAQ